MTNKPGKTIYDLALHETMEVGKHYQDHMFATRVPGGWVYREGKAPGTFVPYSPEFKFSDREKKRRDALDEFDEIEQGHGV
jgi:hypothetical protein